MKRRSFKSLPALTHGTQLEVTSWLHHAKNYERLCQCDGKKKDSVHHYKEKRSQNIVLTSQSIDTEKFLSHTHTYTLTLDSLQLSELVTVGYNSTYPQFEDILVLT